MIYLYYVPCYTGRYSGILGTFYTPFFTYTHSSQKTLSENKITSQVGIKGRFAHRISIYARQRFKEYSDFPTSQMAGGKHLKSDKMEYAGRYPILVFL